MLTLPWEQLPDYPDIGSWKTNHDGSPAFIGCADTGSNISNAAILLHEFVESFWCWQNGVTEKEVSAFDQAWFKAHPTLSNEGPGDDPRAPYYVGHKIALGFEKTFIKMNGMTWAEHEENCDRVYGKRR